MIRSLFRGKGPGVTTEEVQYVLHSKTNLRKPVKMNQDYEFSVHPEEAINRLKLYKLCLYSLAKKPNSVLKSFHKFLRV